MRATARLVPGVRRRRSLLAPLAVAIASPAAIAAVPYQIVARTGDPAPGTSNTFHGWNNPMCRQFGGVASFGNMQLGFGALYNAGIWSGGVGSLGLDALAGAPLPGTGARVISLVSHPTQNRNGVVAFHAVIDPSFGFTDDNALFIGVPGAVSMLVRENNPAPGIAGALFDSFSADPAINDSGTTALLANLRNVPGGTNRAIFAGHAGSLSKVVRTGDALPGFPGVTFTFIGSPVINTAGAVAFGANHSAEPNSGIWIMNAGGAIAPALLPGDPAPGLPAGSTFPFGGGSSSNIPSMNDQGEFAFATIASVGGNNRHGLWTGQPGSLQRRIGSFDPAPGLAAPATIDTIGNALINRGGSVIYNATLNNPPNGRATGIWMYTPGVGNRLVSIVNEQAPEMAPGIIIFSYSTSFTGNSASHSLNNRGEALFIGSLNYTVASTPAFGIFAGRPGRIHKVVASGDLLEVAPGVFRTVVVPYLWTGDSPDTGRFMSINDRGEVAFMAQLDGGEFALCVAQLPHPCPGDTTGDDVVDFIDLNLILSQFGLVGPGLSGDLNGDGTVDFLDLNAVLSFFGGAC